MTWQSFFDFSTMGHRHLVIVYVGVWLIQGAYLGWIAWNWFHIKGPRH
jgi:hypothetical protein